MTDIDLACNDGAKMIRRAVYGTVWYITWSIHIQEGWIKKAKREQKVYIVEHATFEMLFAYGSPVPNWDG